MSALVLEGTPPHLAIIAKSHTKRHRAIRIISARKATNHESTFYKVARHED
jgi:uncharacterized DUF497 family protein